jgi:hypothetical protein
VGLAWGVYLVGLATIDPTSVEWMLSGDWAPPLFGWLYSREHPWALPLGQASGYLYPVGTSLAYTDGTPWLGTFFKLLSPVLPRAFQVHGLWLALCFTLQGFFGARIVACLSPRPLHQLLGGALFVLSPTLNMRLGHLSLCSHWLVLALLWLNVRPCPEARTAHRSLGLALLFVGLAAGVHVYLAAMTLTLALALAFRVWRLDGHLTGPRAGAWAAALLGTALGVMALFGYFTSATTPAPGFTTYSANLLSLIDPSGLSRFLPAIPVGSGQYEGYGYLGLGVLLTGVAALVALKMKGEKPLVPRSAWPLVIACLLMGLFSLSSAVQLAQVRVLSYRALFEGVGAPIAQTFRSPGRFIWPLHYLVILGAIAGLLRVLRHRPGWAAGALGLAVALQGLEMPAELCCGSRFAPEMRPLPGGSATWNLATGDYQHVVLYPPLMVDGAGRGCTTPSFEPPEAAPYAWQAYLSGMTFNSGYVSRVDAPRVQAYCEQLTQDLQQGRFRPDSIYVIHPKATPGFLEHATGKATCGTLDGVLVCVAPEKTGAFRDALVRQSPSP